MPRSALTGSRIRERRGVVGLKQADLARAVEISPSYLNLIEHNRRRIGGKLLVRIARALSVEVSALTQGAEAELLDQLNEAAQAHPEAAAELDRIDELVGRFPGWAALVVSQGRRIAMLEQRVAALADRMTHDPFLSTALHDVLTKVSAIRSTAAILAETEDLDEAWLNRFHRNLDDDSRKLSEGAEALVGYLDADGEVDLAATSPQEELEAFLEQIDFHVAGLERALPETPQALVGAADALRSASGRALAITFLQRYRQDVVRMPLAEFVAAARDCSFDPGRLSLQFGIDLPGVFRRLASLPTSAGQGRIALVVCDGAGALTLRKATEGFPLPRFGAACPLWPLYQALTRPMTPIRAVISHVSSPGQLFLSYAISQPSHPVGFDGPQVHEAMMLVLPADLLGERPDGATLAVGSSCRVCPKPDCPARRERSVVTDGFDSGP